MKFYYIKDNSKIEYRIDRIEYTGKTNGPAPYNVVNFYYETRTVYNTVYMAGSPIINPFLLYRIKITAGGNYAGEYDFKYYIEKYTEELDNYQNYKLNEIIEKGSDNTQLNSTVINWGANIEHPFNYTATIPNIDGNGFQITGDYNGDGKTDIIYIESPCTNCDAKMYINNSSIDDGSSFVLQPTIPLTIGPLGNNTSAWGCISWDQTGHCIESGYTNNEYSKDFKDYLTGDFNGDGKDDIILGSKSSGPTYSYFAYYSTGSSLNHMQLVVNTDVINHKIVTGDFNGDGITDVLFNAEGENFQMYLGKYYNYLTYDGSGGTANLYSSTFMAGDFNGDGKSELLSGSNVYVYDQTTKTFNFSYISGPGYMGDFNGDGKTDILQIILWSGNAQVLYSTGNGYIHKLISNFSCSAQGVNIIQVGDFNGDGKDDFLSLPFGPKTGSQSYVARWPYVYYSMGTEFDKVLWENCYETEIVPKEIHVPVCIMTIDSADNYSQFGSIQTGDFNGDGQQDVIVNDESGRMIIKFHPVEQTRLVKTIVNGSGVKTDIAYKYSTESAVYSRGSYSYTYPIVDSRYTQTLVSSVATSNGLGGMFTTSYIYEGAKLHVLGKGYLGFSKITASNPNGINIKYFNYNNTTNYCNVYLWKTENKNTSNNPVSATTYTNAVHDFGSHRIFPYTSNEETQNYVTGIHTYTDYSYTASEGNITQILTDIKDGSTLLARKSEIYYNYISAGNWGINNKYQNKTNYNYRFIGIASTITRNYIYTWDSNKGTLLSEKDNDYNVLTSYTPDPNYGVITQVSTTGSDFQDRTVTMQYDAKKRFVTKTTKVSDNSQYNIVNEAQYDSKTGNITWSKDENGLITTSSYDGFGRKKKTVLPDGKTIEYSVSWASGQVPANALYYTKAESDGSPYALEYNDLLGRSLRKETQGYNNLVINSDNIYNPKGQLEEKHYLDPAGADVKTTYTYNDPFDRLTQITPDSPLPAITYSYTTPDASGTSVTETNTSADPVQSKTTTTDLTGLTASVTDAGGTVAYTYNSNSQPITISSNGLTTTIGYDNYGRQQTLTDPNAGITNYTYYSNGELHTQTDAKNNVYTMTYDVLGRLKTKILTNDGTYIYNYDTETNGIGKIASITGPNSMSQTYKYDALGRNYQFTENISGTDFVTNYSFDDYGNPTQVTYPGGYSVSNSYDGIGNLTEVKQTTGNISIWKLDAMDYMNHVTQYKTANNTITTNKNLDAVSGNINEIKTGSLFDYSFTFNAATGNLLQRKDKTRNLTENFTYDNLNRLEDAAISGGTTLTTAYLPNGNIDYKSDVLAANSTYSYSSTHPNAVEKIENSVGNIRLESQNIDYTAFNKISHIGEETNTSDLYFYYGVDQQRKKVETKVNNSLTATKYYTAGFEREEIAGSTTTDWNYISGGDGLAAIYIVDNGVGALYWVAKDHLGSIMGLYNQSGTMVEEFSYDAWGRRRNPTNWSYTITQPTLITRGYTMHEHLDNFALINMNGRLYDPILGRMLSPDNFVQDASFTQSYNRYTYCLNNPLKYIDPSGNYYYYLNENWLWSDDLNFDPDYGSGENTSYGGGGGIWVTTFTGAMAQSIFDLIGQGWDLNEISFNSNTYYALSFGAIGNVIMSETGAIAGFSNPMAKTSAGFFNYIEQRGGKDAQSGGGGFYGADVRFVSDSWEASAYFAGAINTKLSTYIDFRKYGLSSPSGQHLMHEYGHYLQNKYFGSLNYNMNIVPTSLINYFTLDETNYALTWTEIQANTMSYYYFGYPDSWNFTDYPINPNYLSVDLQSQLYYHKP